MRSAVGNNVFSLLLYGELIATAMSNLFDDTRNSGGIVICAPVYNELLAHSKATPRFVDQVLLDAEEPMDFDLGERVWREAAHRFAEYAGRRRRSNGSIVKRLFVGLVSEAHAVNGAD